VIGGYEAEIIVLFMRLMGRDRLSRLCESGTDEKCIDERVKKVILVLPFL